uniref:Uncharacterized protein n=1 Tax=Elaeophora elaphi TaxID=1147741 RepID=A0A0R3RKG6_9BILA
MKNLQPFAFTLPLEVRLTSTVTMESLHHMFISTAVFIFILVLFCAFIFWLIRCWRSKSSYELSAAVIQNKQLSQPEFYQLLRITSETMKIYCTLTVYETEFLIKYKGGNNRSKLQRDEEVTK